MTPEHRCQCSRHHDAEGIDDLTGIQRTYLERLRYVLPSGLANREELPVAGEVDPDGMVKFTRCSFEEQVERLSAKRQFEWVMGMVDE